MITQEQAAAGKTRQRVAAIVGGILLITPAAYGFGVLIGDKLEKALIVSLERQWHSEAKARAGGIVRE